MEQTMLMIMLQRRGYEPVFVPGDQTVDDTIKVTEKVTVQLGRDYTCVTRWTDDRKALAYYPNRTAVETLLQDVHSAVHDADWEAKLDKLYE